MNCAAKDCKNNIEGKCSIADAVSITYDCECDQFETDTRYECDTCANRYTKLCDTCVRRHKTVDKRSIPTNWSSQTSEDNYYFGA